MDLIRQSLKRKYIDTASEHGRKIPRLSPPPSSAATTASNEPSRSHDFTPSLITPPTTASLKVLIPQPVLTKEDHRNIKIRRAAARRWVPKLRKPFPKQREITEAYNLKLMRHYRQTITTPEPNFLKPRIDTSPRVMNLLRQCPIAIPASNGQVLEAGNPVGTYATDAQIAQLRRDANNLQINKKITRSEHAKRLAWQSFSSTEKDRRDNGRQALMESGLVTDDLIKEKRGIKNGLPEWKKRYTSKYAGERKSQ